MIKCSVCGKSFKRLKQIKEHMLKEHGQEYEPGDLLGTG